MKIHSIQTALNSKYPITFKYWSSWPHFLYRTEILHIPENVLLIRGTKHDHPAPFINIRNTSISQTSDSSLLPIKWCLLENVGQVSVMMGGETDQAKWPLVPVADLIWGLVFVSRVNLLNLFQSYPFGVWFLFHQVGQLLDVFVENRGKGQFSMKTKD